MWYWPRLASSADHLGHRAASARTSSVRNVGNVVAGDTVTAETWVGGAPKGARFDRHVRFTGDDGKVKVEAKTTWAILDRASGRLVRVPKEVAEPFLAG